MTLIDALASEVPDEAMALAILFTACVCFLWGADLIAAAFGGDRSGWPHARKHRLWLGGFLIVGDAALYGYLGILSFHGPDRVALWAFLWMAAVAVLAVGGFLSLAAAARENGGTG